MTNLTDRIAQLTTQERAELANLLRRSAASASSVPTPSDDITPAPRNNGHLPLSFTQERIWFLEQFSPGTPFHNMSGVARIPLRVEPDVFGDCVNEVVARHEILRTRFVMRDGEPAGIVESRVSVPIRILPAVPASERDELFQQDATRPFDLREAPLLRVSVAAEPGGETLVQLTMHHIVSDGFSTRVFFRELGELYRLRLAGVQSGLPPLPFQFADVAAWERRSTGGQSHVESIAYWSTHLRGAPQRLALPADHPRPPRMTNRGERLRVELPRTLGGQIQALSQGHGVTPFVTMLAGVVATLSRYAAQDDLIVGVPVANRERRGVEQLIGPFLNTLALRFQLIGGLTFTDLVRQVNRTFLAGLDHQELPFERVLQEVQDSRDPSRSPLFQVVFNFQADQSAAGTPGSQLQDLHNGGCDFDLLFDVVSSAGGMAVHIDYYADVYAEDTVSRIAESCFELLRAAASDPGRPVTELPLMAAQAYPAVIANGSGPASAYDIRCRVPDLVLRHANEHPARVALIEGDREITYREISTRSAVVAAQVRQHVGNAAGARVAICLPRSADMIIAVLGVLRAGFSYIPLDPEYPTDRLGFICADVGAAALVTRHSLGDLVPATHLPTVWMGEASGAAPDIETDAQPDVVPDVESDIGHGVTGTTDQCAYIIYTSGSTGRPKGVQVSHRNVVNFLLSMREHPGLGSHDVLLAVTSPSFDIAVLEMLLPLTCGARAVIASSAEVTDGRRLATLIEERRVTVMQATPATWQLMVASGWSGRPSLRALCGGEGFPPTLAAALLARCGEVWNMYGPTETTIWSTIHRVAEDDVSRGSIPIGQPIANTTALVLDAGLNPVPRGVLGELCLGGDGVSLGYFGRPDLTAAGFVAPAWLDGQRVYRTGDLVRVRADGILDFAGRTDHQVKIRGFRIELGEIEAVLDAHPGVARAVAMVVENGTDADRSIVSYVQPSRPNGVSGDPEGEISVAGLQSFAGKRLPYYMVPSRVVLLAEFPLTPNGKIDRNSLRGLDPHPDVDPERTDAPHGIVAPRTETEEVIAAIWRDLLGLPEVGVEDSFFELGGHSLLATKLIFRIREVLGADLPLTTLFDGRPTVARLAALVTEGVSANRESDEALDLAAEARLAEEVRPAPGAHVNSVQHPQHILLTGATGFVGAFLLAELLRTTEASVFCLVRAASASEGRERIRDAMTEYGIWDSAVAGRILPVPGTLSHPHLGLGRPQWQHLAEMVDVIYHCGAEVNFLQKYPALKPANVRGTEEVLRLACEGSVKPVHFVSTIYVFSRFMYPPGTEFMEDMAPVHDLDYTFGYTQSKWVSEQMVLEAGRRGLPVYIYRLGRVAGHSRTGACQTYDFVWQVTRVGIEMAAAPIMDMTLDVTPVDYVAGALVHLSRQPGLQGKAFHLLSPKQITEPEFVSWLERYGYRGDRITFQEWCDRVIQRATELSDRTAGALAPFLSGALPLDRMPAAHFDQSNVELGLRGSGISCPPMSEDLLRVYLDYFRDSGYLPVPAGAAPVLTTV
jgi:amino acid adenylation domain-containing protein/thioester reductase-like protein